MRKPAPLPAELVDGVFTTRHASRLGVSARRLRARDVQAPFRGVRIQTSSVLKLVERCRALQRVLPKDAVFSGPTAAALQFMPLPHRLDDLTEMHVTVPLGIRAPSRKGVRARSALLPDTDLLARNGLRLTTPVRTWCDLALTCNLVELVIAGDFVIHHRSPLAHVAELRKAIESRKGRRGSAKLRKAIGLLDARAESPQESRLRVLMVLNGIVGFESNGWVATSSGHRYRGDFVFAREKVIVEYQGAHHFDPAWQRADMTRKSRLAADKWTIIEVNADDWADEVELVARIRRALMPL